LSSATSIALHALVLALLALIGWSLARLATAQHPALADVPVVVTPGGSSGALDGDGKPVGGPRIGPDAEDTGPKPDKAKAVIEPPRINEPRIAPPPTSSLDNQEELERLLKKSEQARIELERITKENRAKLRQALAPRDGKGPPGPGGKGGSGKDKLPGDGTGPHLGTAEEREARLDRWVMVFDTYSGDDYARQLAGLGAYLGVPRRDGDSVSYIIIRDLQARPASGKFEDLAEIGRIHWTDAKHESIAPLCHALGIRPVPDHVLAFFPPELERKLLQMELRYKGVREDQIKETRFKVRRTAGGYEPVVIEQTAKKPT
jgi:hypothetical protein